MVVGQQRLLCSLTGSCSVIAGSDCETNYIRGDSMTKEAIKEHVHAAPFRPFAVRLPDGRSYPVPGPDYASVSPNGRLMTTYTNEANGARLLDVALITEITELSSDER